MKKDLIVRLEGIIFSSSDLLTLAEKDFLKKRDYSSSCYNQNCTVLGTSL